MTCKEQVEKHLERNKDQSQQDNVPTWKYKKQLKLLKTNNADKEHF